MSSQTLKRLPSLHQRGTAAVILSRHAPVLAEANPGPPHPTFPGDEPVRRWQALLVWALLGAAIAGLWTLLLFGDSLAA
jgi:hypothetical protein